MIQVRQSRKYFLRKRKFEKGKIGGVKGWRKSGENKTGLQMYKKCLFFFRNKTDTCKRFFSEVKVGKDRGLGLLTSKSTR